MSSSKRLRGVQSLLSDITFVLRELAQSTSDVSQLDLPIFSQAMAAVGNYQIFGGNVIIGNYHGSRRSKNLTWCWNYDSRTDSFFDLAASRFLGMGISKEEFGAVEPWIPPQDVLDLLEQPNFFVGFWSPDDVGLYRTRQEMKDPASAGLIKYTFSFQRPTPDAPQLDRPTQ